MRKMWPAVVMLAAFTAACGSGGDNADLVQSRYGACLSQLNAQESQALDYYVSYTTDAGFLTFHIVKRNGKTYTFPAEDKDTEILASVGC